MSVAADLKKPGVTPDNVRASKRRLLLKALDMVPTKPVRWLWQHRIASGMFGLLAGREGLGKSLITYQTAADISRGKLDGDDYGTPRNVIICATEDSLSHTIVPRLIAASADLTRIKVVDAFDDGHEDELSLPVDIDALAKLAQADNVALIVLDPLMSRLSAKLDTHKDSDVRRALEPVTKLAEATGAAVLGIIHVNKGSSGDPLTSIMGSRAFSAVARYTLFVAADPDDENIRLLAQAKNNVGPTDSLSLLPFTIEPFEFINPEGDQIETARIVWQEIDRSRSLREVIGQQAAGASGQAREEAEEWLRDFLQGSKDQRALSADVKKAADEAEHAASTVKRAAGRLGVVVTHDGRRTWWAMPPAPKLDF